MFRVLNPQRVFNSTGHVRKQKIRATASIVAPKRMACDATMVKVLLVDRVWFERATMDCNCFACTYRCVFEKNVSTPSCDCGRVSVPAIKQDIFSVDASNDRKIRSMCQKYMRTKAS